MGLWGLTLAVLFGGGGIATLIGIDSLPKHKETLKEILCYEKKAKLMRRTITKFPGWNTRYWIEIGENKIYEGEIICGDGLKISIPKYGLPRINGKNIR